MGDGTGSGRRPNRAEEAAADERLRTIAGYTNLAREGALAEEEELSRRIGEAEARKDRTEVVRLRDRREGRRRYWIWLVIALVVVLIVLLALWLTRGTDLTADLADSTAPAASAPAEDPDPAVAAFPPEQVADPADVLPPEAIMYTCFDGDRTVVTQVELDLNQDAKYQYAYEACGSRIAILTVQEGSEYDSMAESLAAQYESDSAAGIDVAAPKVLDGVADGAMVYGSTAIFRNGDDAGILWANTLVDAGGEAALTIEPDELESLARIAAPRM